MLTNNSASYRGGGIYCGESSPILENMTLTNNTAYIGGGIYCYSSSPSLINTILWNKSPQEVYFTENDEPNSIMIAYSNIQAGEAGIETNNNGTVYWEAGNIDADPLFVDAANGDYHLTEDSPCIDAGTAFFEWEGEVLVNMSEDEYIGSAPDMGAFEYSDSGAIDDDLSDIPAAYTLFQNYPNPFRTETTFSFLLSSERSKQYELSIYNIKGQKVKSFSNQKIIRSPNQQIIWNAEKQASGIYFYKLTVNDVSLPIRKCILLK